jgi:hypothetical protein
MVFVIPTGFPERAASRSKTPCDSTKSVRRRKTVAAAGSHYPYKKNAAVLRAAVIVTAGC